VLIASLGLQVVERLADPRFFRHVYNYADVCYLLSWLNSALLEKQRLQLDRNEVSDVLLRLLDEVQQLLKAVFKSDHD